MRANKKLQQGASFWEMSLYILVFLFVISIAIKLGPHYVEDANIGSALDGVREAVGGKNASELTNADIKSSISKFFQVSMLPSEVQKQIEIVRNNGDIFIMLDYESRVPFMANVDIVLRFHHEVNLTD